MKDIVPAPERLRVALVTGLSGGGKASILRALEDIGYEAVDNPPLTMIEEMVARSERPLAVGVDARTRGFDAGLVLEALQRLRDNPALRAELVFAGPTNPPCCADTPQPRRRHPLAPQGRRDRRDRRGGSTDRRMLREQADLVIDTSELPLPALRQQIEHHFGTGSDTASRRMVVSLVSFAIPMACRGKRIWYSTHAFCGIPHYDPYCNLGRGWIPAVGAYIAADPGLPRFFSTAWRN